MAIQPLKVVPRAVSSGAVELLERWLERAKAGELLEVSLVAFCADGKYTLAGSDCSNSLQLVGIYMKQIASILGKD